MFLRTRPLCGARARLASFLVVALVPTVVACTPGGPSTPAPGTPNGNPFAGETLYVDPGSAARNTVNTWRAQGRTADAQQLEKIAGAPKPVRYFAEWTETGNSNGVAFQVNHYVDLVAGTGALPVIGAYAIINRDCGSFSGGGFTTAQQYRAWIDGYAEGIGDDKVVVILEPDAIAGMGCLSAAQQTERLSLLSYAVDDPQNASPIMSN